MEQKNVIHLNTFHGNSFTDVKSLQRFVLEKGIVECKIIQQLQGRGNVLGFYRN